MGANAYLYNLGWRPSTVKAGDTLTVTVVPLRSGKPGRPARPKPKTADGKTLGGRKSMNARRSNVLWALASATFAWLLGARTRSALHAQSPPDWRGLLDRRGAHGGDLGFPAGRGTLQAVGPEPPRGARRARERVGSHARAGRIGPKGQRLGLPVDDELGGADAFSDHASRDVDHQHLPRRAPRLHRRPQPSRRGRPLADDVGRIRRTLGGRHAGHRNRLGQEPQPLFLFFSAAVRGGALRRALAHDGSGSHRIRHERLRIPSRSRRRGSSISSTHERRGSTG